ncbi:hypothetical protein [Planctomicrobium piriforme]|uniref:Uncharacterized protein n=1 Tax=Planctomicrobium piriforme TaxID=1576369 RepID=A0A1I3ECG4_9PLAN|nr:hypothetical protein [Planctomicrobium piriforme]SFH96664.1 hypothetical protein SAMN05421753_104164 [Planctomicrobium piriforme]
MINWIPLPEDIGAVPETRTVNGHPLSADVTVSKSDVGLGNVTNDVQTRSAVVPNTAPSAGQLLIGNAGGTAYAPVAMSGDATIASTGAVSIGAGKITNAMLVGSIDLTTKVTGTLPVVNGGNGLATATLGGIRYASGANMLAELAGNTTTTKLFLTQTGNGSVSAAPAWNTIASSDLPGYATTTHMDLTGRINLGLADEGLYSDGMMRSLRSRTGIAGGSAMTAQNVTAVYGEFTDTSGTVLAMRNEAAIKAVANTAANFRVFSMTLTYDQAGINHTGAINAGTASIFGECRPINAGTITGCNAAFLTGLSLTSALASLGTVTDVAALSVRGISSSGHAISSTVTRSVGIRILNGFNTAGTTVTGQCGLMIEAQATIATNNSNIVIGALTVPTGQFSIYNVSTANNYFNANLNIGTTTYPTSATMTLTMFTGTAPSGTQPADTFSMYSSDAAAANACPTFKTESGQIIKLYQVASAAQAAVATTPATNITPYGFSQTQADGLIALANALQAAGVLQGLIKGSA